MIKAKIISILGDIPNEMIASGSRSSNYFIQDKNGYRLSHADDLVKNL